MLPSTNAAVEKKTVRLSNAFIPSAYRLHIHADLMQWTYTAEEEVTLVRNPAVPYRTLIQLHADPNMDITEIAGATLVKRDAKAHTIHLQLPSTEEESESFQVSFTFSQSIQEELQGFYRVRYRHNNAEYRMASTHFEPVSARRFFICQDEPSMRADFSLTVSLPKSLPHVQDYVVVSNGPLRSKQSVGSSVVHEFETIPRCPPYLTACVVGLLECVSATAGKHQIPIRVLTTPGKVDRAAFALETVTAALDYFEEFFSCPFPLPKLDVVAVPDFPIGGMENWGCITCVESILVNASTSINMKKRAAELLCHEVSHNWFGNLVAIDWWEGLWLKEGFASWCGNWAVNIAHPEWDIMTEAMQSVNAAKEVDQYDHSHPVEVPIVDPGDITQMFDSISYNKGMGLVSMLQSFLGEDKWQKAVADYINTYAYQATKTRQLGEALETSSGEPIEAVMTSFTEQLGFPLIHVERISPEKITIRQEPCRQVTTQQRPREVEVQRLVQPPPVKDGEATPVAEGVDGEAADQPHEAEGAVPAPQAAEQLAGVDVTTVESVPEGEGDAEVAAAAGEEAAPEEPLMETVIELEDTIWAVPIVIQGPPGQPPISVVLNEKGPVELEVSEADFPYFVVNPMRKGFYRCRYDDALFAALLQNYTSLTHTDRCALLSDVKAALSMGYSDLHRFGHISTLMRTHDSQNTMVVTQFTAAVKSLTGAFRQGELVSLLQRAQLNYLIPLATRYVTPEGMAVASQDCAAEQLHHTTIDLALSLLIDHYHPSEVVHHPLAVWAFSQAEALLTTGAAGAGIHYQVATLRGCLALYNRLDPHTTPEERHTKLRELLVAVDGQDELVRALLFALCHSTNPAYVEEVVLECIMGTRVRSHYGTTVFHAAAANPSTPPTTMWNFFRHHFQKIKEQWGNGQFRIQMIVECMASTLSGDAAARDFLLFFEDHPLENAKLAIGRSVENIHMRAWLRRRWSPEDLMAALDPHEL